MKIPELLFALCSYGVYYYGNQNPNRTYQLICGGVAAFQGLFLAMNSMVNNLSIASLTVQPNCETLRMVMFNGKQFDSEIKNCKITQITKRQIDMRINVNDRTSHVLINIEP